MADLFGDDNKDNELQAEEAARYKRRKKKEKRERRLAKKAAAANLESNDPAGFQER